MQSRFVDSDAEAMINRYANAGVNSDLALRVYTTRLIGQDPKLVLHGGGNTSVKTFLCDLLGEETEVLCVKGSGREMGHIEPNELPALRLNGLRKLRALEVLPDEELVRIQRANLLDPMAPNPSVETLLHAFVPHKFVDHTHSIAILSLIDQPNGRELCAEVYKGRLGIVPYVLPGFGLAKKSADTFDADPKVEGLILNKHGIFTFGATARESYERMIEMVSLAEGRLKQGRTAVFATAQLPQKIAPLAQVAPILRGACSLKDLKVEGAWQRLILEFRTNQAILNFVNGAEVARYSQAGVVTPDHTIRIKNWPLVVAAPVDGKIEDFKNTAQAAAQQFIANYKNYFERNNARFNGTKQCLDPLPRVILVPGLGLFGLGQAKKEARVSADLAEAAIETITGAESVGRFESISEFQMFECEYWSLEQAKLGKRVEQPLAGQIAVITGAGSGIGAATAKAFASAGAEVALLDIDENTAEARARELGDTALAVVCDVRETKSISAAFDKVVEAFGGVDIVVSNTGAAWQGRIGEVDEALLKKSFELNFFSHQRVGQAAVKVMLAQGTGGCLLFNVSKQAINPGPNFGPYGLPKAATLFLMRQYALEYGVDGIRANAVNADRVRSGMMTDEFVAERSKARGLSEREYMSGNLLGREVIAEDVAQAFLAQALALKTTADVTTVDGGNIAAALR